ncbi:uncharacterized protein LOC126660727 [Mercurialis annua]|uniref:uncharacterized protein LOC126660727 n=1 Tax=Mercurialis annua TaxID=3986 RepID=UPI00215FD9DC|nr:uncharacterized protein LOC126660727 [Mercurialis annua]
MNNSDQEKQNQSSSSGMEDSTAMTIEFLRARLLSERSASRTWRQRADELAKRVAELEEHLRIVSRQRMKAEKATADVLAILEDNGVSDFSETVDSSSDQDTPCESKVGYRSSKEEENSVNSKVKNNESEEFSGSDRDSSLLHGRSLSWKGRKGSSRSLEKFKDPSLGRRSSFASVDSSPKQRPGKSCRQRRRNESRSVAEEYKANPVKHDSLEDEAVATSENFPNCSDFEPKTGEDKMMLEDTHSECAGAEYNACNTGLDYNVYREDRDIEKTLEHQAQLIGQYEAMENTQREWEEKFRENSSSTPDSCDPGNHSDIHDSCDPGNHSDITEERYEIRAPARDPAMPNGFQTQEKTSEVEDLSKNQSNGFPPSSHVDAVFLEKQKSASRPDSELSTQDSAFPVSKEKPNKESPGRNSHSSFQIPHHDSASLCSQYSLGNQAADLPSNADSSSNKGKTASGSDNELYALVPHTASDGLGSVLEALKEARQSLQQKIKRLPPVAESVRKSVEPCFPVSIPGDKVQVPIGCVGLFRLPTDFSVEGNTRSDLLSSSARFSLGNHYSNSLVPVTANNHFVSSPYSESRPHLSTESQLVASQYVGGGSRISSPKPYFDPYLDTGLPSSSRYSYPNFPINTSYPDLMPRMPSREAFLTSNLGRTVGSSTSAFIDDNNRPNIYR